MTDIQKALRSRSSTERKEKNEYFFKTGKGSYSEGDQFIGVRMPDVRAVAKQFANLSYPEIKSLLYSKVHEDRLCALVILVDRSKKSKPEERTLVTKFYLKHKNQVNNWDLVDVSAHYILGQHILDYPDQDKILDTLVTSKNMWHRRIAMVSTWIMIRARECDRVYKLAEQLLDDHEGLMHKAVGWMLREAWKKEPQRVEQFLQGYYGRIPRTTLRYAIERMHEPLRKQYLNGSF